MIGRAIHRCISPAPLLLGIALLLQGLVAGAVADHPLVKAEALRAGYSLSGQWLFQPGDDPTWADPGLDDSRWARLAVPQPWPEGGFPASGQIAWYRLTLKLDVDDPLARGELSTLGLRIGMVHDAYELYAGGQLLGGVGRLPPLSEVQYDREAVYHLPPGAIAADGTLVLALRVWGGPDASVNNWASGPYGGEFALGDYTTLVMSRALAELPGMLLNVLFIGFGLYHLYLYRRNPQLDTFLWFGLIAINIGIYGMMLNQWKYISGWYRPNTMASTPPDKPGTIAPMPTTSPFRRRTIQLPTTRFVITFVLVALIPMKSSSSHHIVVNISPSGAENSDPYCKG